MRLPQLIIPKLKRLPGKHFSLADWDFEADHRYWITTLRYISSPSCLSTPSPTGGTYYYYCYLKDNLAHNVPDGRFITHIRSETEDPRLSIFFRQQPPLVHLGNKNGYRIFYDPFSLYWRLYRFQNDVETLVGSKPIPHQADRVWKRIRFDFYQYISGTLIRTLRVHAYYHDGTNWISWDYIEDGTNAFADSDVNRIGFALRGYHQNYPDSIDDTEIWKKA